jgi:hypothetical protein
MLLTKVAANPKVAACPESVKIAPEVVALLERRKMVAQMNLREEVVPLGTDVPLDVEQTALLDFLGLLAQDVQLKEDSLEPSLQEHRLNTQLGLLVAPCNSQDASHYQSDNNFLPNDCIQGWHCKPPARSPSVAWFLVGKLPREEALLVGFQILLQEEGLLVEFQFLLQGDGLLVGFQILLQEEVGHASQIVAAAHTIHS